MHTASLYRRLTLYFPLVFALLLPAINTLSAQCTTNHGSLRITEVGSLKRGGNAEYIELLVLPDPNAPGVPVDLRGFVVDDNNVAMAYEGTAPGHLRLGDCFEAVQPGTLILLYNAADVPPGIDPSQDGAPNAAGVWQLSSRSACLKGYAEHPSPISPYYFTSQPTAANWEYINLTNCGDGVQVRNTGNNAVDGIYWITRFFPAGGFRIDGIAGDFSFAEKAVALENGIWKTENVIPSPGRPNTAADQYSQLAMREAAPLPFLLIASANASATYGNADGSFDLTIDGPADNYIIQIDDQAPRPAVQPGMHTLSGLSIGVHLVKVTGNNGAGCVVTTGVTIKPRTEKDPGDDEDEFLLCTADLARQEENIQNLLQQEGFQCLPAELRKLSGFAPDKPQEKEVQTTCDYEITTPAGILTVPELEDKINAYIAAFTPAVANPAVIITCGGASCEEADFPDQSAQFDAADLAVWVHLNDQTGDADFLCFKTKVPDAAGGQSISTKSVEEIMQLLEELISEPLYGFSSKSDQYLWRLLDELTLNKRIVARKFIYEGNIYWDYQGQNNSTTCLTPTGKLFSIPKEATAAFHPAFNEWPAGCLVGYKYRDEIIYGWRDITHPDKPFLGYGPALHQYYENGPAYIVESLPVNIAEVYAAIAVDCSVLVLKGDLTAQNTQKFETTESLTPVASLPIDNFESIDEAERRYLTTECLGGQDNWCRERYADHPYLTTHPDPYVQEHPCVLGTLEHYNFEPDNIHSEWMEGFKNLVAISIGFAFTPVLAEIILPELLGEIAREKAKDAVVGFAMDLLLQATFKYWFSDTPVSISESFKGLDYHQATASAIEGVLSGKGKLTDIAISAGMSCAVDGFTENGAFREGFSGEDCLKGATSALFIAGLINSKSVYGKLKSLSKTGLAKGLIRMSENTGWLPKDVSWDFYKSIRNAPLNADDIKALFDITSDKANQIAERIQNSTELQDVFKSGDWWIKIRSLVPDPTLRAEFLDDITTNPNLAQQLKDNEGLVRAWDALFELPLFRINVTKLQAVSDFCVAKNIDPSLVKTELNALSNYKDDLIKSFEISNGTLPHPLITNKGIVQTDGNLLGRLVNGQFVPVGNANAAGTMDYVIKQSGEILLGSKHTFLSSGADVLAAGTVKFNNGSIRAITNASGHYLPTPGEGMNFLRLFKANGADISNATLSMYHDAGTLFKEILPSSPIRKLYD